MQGTGQFTDITTPSSGTGVEVRYTGTEGNIMAYNRDGSSYLPMSMYGSVIKLATDGSKYGIYIDNDGKVGIGTTSPSSQLEVNGQIKSSAGSHIGYDVTVCASGCDYTSIASAFTTEGDSKSYFIAGGTYNETSVMDIPSSSNIFWSKVTVNGGTNNIYLNGSSTSNTVMSGHLTIQGVGLASNATLIYFGGSNNDYSNFSAYITPEDNASLSSFLPIRLSGSYCDYGSIIIKDLSFEFAGNGSVIWPYETTYSKANIFIENIEMTTTGTLSGMRVQGNSSYNIFEVIIKNVQNAGTGGAYGLLFDSGSDYNQISGITLTAKNR